MFFINDRMPTTQGTFRVIAFNGPDGQDYKYITEGFLLKGVNNEFVKCTRINEIDIDLELARQVAPLNVNKCAWQIVGRHYNFETGQATFQIQYSIATGTTETYPVINNGSIIQIGPNEYIMGTHTSVTGTNRTIHSESIVADNNEIGTICIGYSSGGNLPPMSYKDWLVSKGIRRQHYPHDGSTGATDPQPIYKTTRSGKSYGIACV
jgi:hypothetical protein